MFLLISRRLTQWLPYSAKDPLQRQIPSQDPGIQPRNLHRKWSVWHCNLCETPCQVSAIAVCPENSLLEWTATDVEGVTIINVYKRPSVKMDTTGLPYFSRPCRFMYAGDFNCHSTTVLLMHLEKQLKTWLLPQAWTCCMIPSNQTVSTPADGILAQTPTLHLETWPGRYHIAPSWSLFQSPSTDHCWYSQ